MLRLLLALVAVLPACATNRIHAAWHSKSVMGLTDRDGTDEVDVSCPLEAESMRAELSLRCTAGEVRVVFTDPEGRVCCEELVRGGAKESTWQWPGLAGRWACRLEFDGFAGDYRVVLSCGDESLPRVRVEIEPTSRQAD